MWRRLLGGLARESADQRLPTAQLATAVLLLECARADFEHSEPELAAVRDALQSQFGLAPEAIDQLMSEGQREARRAVSLHEYVARLNRELPHEEKRGLIAHLWKVAWADGRIDAHEEHLLRKLADLLHVPHSVLIQEKLAAERNTGS